MPVDILVPLAGMATGVLLLLPIVRSVVKIAEKRLMGGTESDKLSELREELRAVQDRLERVEFADDRIAELEERLDFTERMLAQEQRKQIDSVRGG